MYILLAGVPPFNGKNNVQILDSVRTKKVLDYPPKHWSAVSPEALEVVQMMLERDVSKRPAASALVKHAWFQKNIQGVESQTKSSLDRAIHQMRQFQGAVKLRQAALLYLASKLTDTDEVQELKDIFQSMDLNHDGRLDRYELEQALKAFSNKEDVAEVQNLVDEVMGGMDLDHTGTVEYSEFLAAAVDHSRLLTSSRLESAFKLFDLDGSGFIELDELRKILDGQVSDADWEAICSEVDQDNNKQIDFDEFKHMMNESTWL
ncbi:MAG: uncharacterized protein KVP18_004150 [Porospora cf. gigantea A]|uniref:uncharacterized protein n=1 Tax=Porospora cf. gigantea A TaxID=2853593 RepID=UPI0035597C5F|nr:MAG: hypothetical protein KVP18_004150 [Porospora cf. gigantea A]